MSHEILCRFRYDIVLIMLIFPIISIFNISIDLESCLIKIGIFNIDFFNDRLNYIFIVEFVLFLIGLITHIIIHFLRYHENLESEHVIRECSICLENIESQDKSKILKECNHSFHYNCINKWLDLRSTCPVCRCAIENRNCIKRRHRRRVGSDYDYPF